MPLSPADAALTDAAHTPLSAAPEGGFQQRLDVACTPTTTRLRLNGAPLEDAPLAAAWDQVRAALVALSPIAWPLGFRLLVRDAPWDRWKLDRVYLFGHSFAPAALGIDPDRLRWNWKHEPIGLHSLAARVEALAAYIPPSNGPLQAYSEGHRIMGTPYVSTRRVLARSPAEALAKMAWAYGGTKGIDELLAKGPARQHWLVVADLARAEDDGFGDLEGQDTALDALRRHHTR